MCSNPNAEDAEVYSQERVYLQGSHVRKHEKQFSGLAPEGEGGGVFMG